MHTISMSVDGELGLVPSLALSIRSRGLLFHLLIMYHIARNLVHPLVLVKYLSLSIELIPALNF